MRSRGSGSVAVRSMLRSVCQELRALLLSMIAVERCTLCLQLPDSWEYLSLREI